MKRVLIDWLYEVCKFYGIDNTVLQYSLMLLKKFENIVNDIPRKDYQLVACVMLNLSLKFLEDEEFIGIELWCDLAGNSFDRENFIGMEMFVLQILKYNLNVEIEGTELDDELDDELKVSEVNENITVS